MEPGQLKRGKEFEEEVYARWLERSEAKVEHKVHLVRGKGSGNRGQADLLIRLDIPILDPLQGTRMSRHAVIVEIKAIDELSSIHKAQLLTYLKAADMRVGLLINFNVPVLKNGLKRMVNHYTEAFPTPRSSAPSAQTPGKGSNADSLSSSSPRFSPHLSVSAVSRGSR